MPKLRRYMQNESKKQQEEMCSVVCLDIAVDKLKIILEFNVFVEVL